LTLIGSVAEAQSLATPSPLDPVHGAELFDGVDGPNGVRAGPFEIRAAGGVAVAYDSNVYSSRSDAVADPLAVGELLLLAQDDSGRRRIDSRAYVRSRRFQDAGDQDTDEYGASLDFATWPDAQDQFSASLAAERRFESRVDVETPTNIPVSNYDTGRGELTWAHRFNRLTFRAESQARRFQYDDVTQQYRDRSVYRGELVGAYEARADLAFTLTGSYHRDAYDDPGPTTDSANTVSVLSGIRIDLRDLLELELGAGYFERRFDSGATPLDGIALRGLLTWQPTRLTRVRGELSRSDEPTQLPGTLAKIRTDVSLRVAHDWSRTLQLFVGARGVLDDLAANSGVDHLYLAELGGNLQLGRHSALGFSYYYGSRDNVTPYRNFSRQLVSLTFTGRL
jgi:hypothetical protein